MTTRVPSLVLALAALAPLARAGDAPAPTPTPPAAAAGRDAQAILLAPAEKPARAAPPADSDGETRAVSPGIAAALASGMPKYSPPTPTPAVTAEPKDLREVDKPKNEIKRLPKYIVNESRPPVFRQQDLYTKEGLTALSFKAHPGLLFGNILGLNDSVAYQMYLDDQRKAAMDDLADTAHAMALGGDAAEGSYILQQSQQTYLRDEGSSIGQSPAGAAK